MLSSGATVGFSKSQFTEGAEALAAVGAAGTTIILDFRVDDVDEEVGRIDRLGVEWVVRPADQPWGSRSMMFRDPEGHLVNVFSRTPGTGQGAVQ